MAAIVERSATEDLADAYAALDDVTRYAANAQAHLRAALHQDEIPPDALDCARHVTEITAEQAHRATARIRAARRTVVRELAD